MTRLEPVAGAVRARQSCAKHATRAAMIGPVKYIAPEPFCWHEDRSVMFTHLRSVRLRSLHSDSHHITSLVFPELSCWNEVRPWLVAMLQRQRLLRLAPHTMHRIVFVAVDRTHEERSVTHSHDAQGLGLTASAVRYLRALLRRSLGPLCPGTRPPCFVRLRGWTGIPTLTTLRVALLPPLKGRVVGYDDPCQR